MYPLSMPPRIAQLRRVDGRAYLTVEEAADRLGVKAAVIRNYLNGGKLTTFKFKTLTLLSAKELAAWPGRKSTPVKK